jgi:N-acyl-D-amino-acid deacylase
MGEGNSMGPLNEAMKQELIDRQSDIRYDIEWTTLDEYLEYLVRRGISTNVASFIGAATPRKYVIGYEDRAPTPEELEEMQQIVREAMAEGAMGVASSLMYPPGLFADTAELIALSDLAHARRGRAHAGGDRGTDNDRPRGRNTGRDLPSQVVRATKLAPVR